jgi:2-alkenal reductase
MNRRQFAWTAGIGCGVLFVLLVAGVAALLILPLGLLPVQRTTTQQPMLTPVPGAVETQVVVPTLTPSPASQGTQALLQEPSFVDLHSQVNPGVVNIQVFIQQGGTTGAGAGSGFILDNQGHIVTNNHVVADASRVSVTFFDGSESWAQVVGTDPYSDLAVIHVDSLPQGAHPLPLGDSDQVQVGEWVVAMGNPFALGSSMTVGIVSAVGRLIPSGATTFSIPQAIQTDAAINPGNSGGPLIDLQGNVVGVNAQIASGSGGSNSGVGFAIPANIVRRVTPALIASGSFQWPWLGIRGDSVSLLVQQANDLPADTGAYVHEVIAGGPAEAAGLQGSTGSQQILGLEVPVGGDVVLEADGQAVKDFAALLDAVSSKSPGDRMVLVILRGGQRREVTVQLAPRPSDLTP